jgi:hypothetical protein
VWSNIGWGRAAPRVNKGTAAAQIYAPMLGREASAGEPG